MNMMNAFKEHIKLARAHGQMSPKRSSESTSQLGAYTSPLRTSVDHSFTCKISPRRSGGSHASTTFISFGSSNRSTGAGHVRGTFRSTSSRFENGKCVTTRRTVQDGVETIEVEENGVLKTKTINGRPVAITTA
ncbi:unnamed protein product [Dicrocoelium dendriticum]|nr:unnamed protein product [Dicrocoelium dendriticum]